MKSYMVVRNNFINQWGTMGTEWGINRTMAQIHALLMVSEPLLDTERIMKELTISRGNANTNLRELVNWGLVYRHSLPGDRREYFSAEKDVWRMFCTIAKERKRREFEPALKVINDSIADLEGSSSVEAAAFKKQMKSLAEFIETANGVTDKITKEEMSKFLPKILKLLG